MSEPLVVRFKKVHPGAITPEYKTVGAAAFDIGLVEELVIAPRGITKTRTGLVIQVPDGHVLLLASRSSNAPKKGLSMANGIGVIDSDYRGPNDEIHLVFQNLTDAEIRIPAGERVAQGLILPVPPVVMEEITDSITESDRGGFGSTG